MANPTQRNSHSKLWLLSLISLAVQVESQCTAECDLALASYYVWQGSNFTFISQIFSQEIDYILSFNPDVQNKDIVLADTRLNIPFPCGCIDGGFLGHVFSYSVVSGDTYTTVAETYYSNLTTVQSMVSSNSYPAVNIPDNAQLNVTVNCSCGNSIVSKDYGLFITYPLRPGEDLASVANESGLPSQLLQSYNPNSNFSLGSGLVFIPGKAGISGKAIAGISVAGVVGCMFLAFCVYVGLYKRKKVVEASLLPEEPEDRYIQHGHGSGTTLGKPSESAALVAGASPGLTGITVDKSVEFSYEELAKATDDFSLANKIGQGGFGAVYYAELRGEKAAIKKMDMQASKEFLAELKVLTHVHHLNLVRLIGYCVEGSLFLVYEFIENGNLNQHLRPSELTQLEHVDAIQFDDVLNQPDPKEDLRKYVDPRLGDNYPIDSVRKMAQLAKACTHENPQLRPSMRSIVVALMTLSSSTEDWDVGSFYENQGLVNLMSGR
ncbi:hypothetical protein L1049_009973 [Liquidambar formosana]|uniref:Protein kinase domain-containing protein n=1 Tax=Liquidambar formosana TaxID=63359 RepID=A0AAP0N9D9_LIQFO